MNSCYMYVRVYTCNTVYTLYYWLFLDRSALKLSHLTRGSLHSSYISPAPVSRDPSLTTSIITDTISLSPVIKLPKRRLPTSKQTPKLLASKQRSTPVHSSVMVATQEYTFSPPSTVAPPPPPTSTATPMAVDDEASTPPAQDKAEYVFSPPLLRSASRERKAKELSQFGTGLVADTPNTRYSIIVLVCIHAGLHTEIHARGGANYEQVGFL